MDFLAAGIPAGRYFGIPVRLHITFLIYAFYRIQEVAKVSDWAVGVAYVAGLYGCILLHEFGHALAARWCDGQASQILLWPLGGLAYCRPAFHPTAHLITTVAGPFVTFVLWLGMWGVSTAIVSFVGEPTAAMRSVLLFAVLMSHLNLFLLLFNLIPAFPMDGGRILRDTLWHWMSVETATQVAVWVSRVIAALGVAYAVYSKDYFLILIAVFIVLQASRELRLLAFEAMAPHEFSIRERLRRGRRQAEFRAAAWEQPPAAPAEVYAFHRCATCGRTEADDRHHDFRVCPDCSGGQEYCAAHLNAHQHT